MTDEETNTLITDLVAWREHAFHADRQLADRVLLATGWRCLPDPGHPAGVKWEVGRNPVVTAWEPHHPHPVNSLDDALRQLPPGCRIGAMAQYDCIGEWRVLAVTGERPAVEALHLSLPIAVCITAVTAWRHHDG
jgi:hypothetical protein